MVDRATLSAGLLCLSCFAWCITAFFVWGVSNRPRFNRVPGTRRRRGFWQPQGAPSDLDPPRMEESVIPLPAGVVSEKLDRLLLSKIRAGRGLQINTNTMSWIHIPKCGTSFLHTLLLKFCNGTVTSKQVKGVSANLIGHRCHALQRPRCWTDHRPLVTNCASHTHCSCFSMSRGSLMALFRQPEERLVSAWFDGRHDAPLATKWGDFVGNLTGCQVRMLNGKACGSGWTKSPVMRNGGPVTRKMLGTALERLEDGFAFVGIVGEWALTICLFNTMFSLSPCSQIQFANVRPGRMQEVRDSSQLVRKMVGNWSDSFDGPLYDRAYEIFQARLAYWNVNERTCRAKGCWPRA